MSASTPMTTIHRGRWIKLFRAEEGVHTYPGVMWWAGRKIGHVRVWPLPPVRVDRLARERELEAAWLHGRTRKGHTVVIMQDPYIAKTPAVFVDGYPAKFIDPPHGVGSVQRLRDGGTTTIYTDAGVIVRPAPRLNRPATLDGEELRT